MTIQQQGAAVALPDCMKLACDGRMIGTVRGLEPFLELGAADCPAPQIAVLLGPGGYDSEAAAGARPNFPARRVGHN